MSASSRSPQLDSKFVPQISTRTPLPRPRLALPAALLDGPCRVVSVVAPAGYGKSTLLADWYSQCAAERRAWLNLSERDDEPTQLLRLLIGAIQTAHPKLGQKALTQLDGQSQANPMSVLELLVSDLSQLSEALLLFIDDLHLLNDARSLQILDWLLQYAPHQLRLIIGSRQAPPVALATLRLRGQLAELDQSQLALTAEEAAALCSERISTPLSALALSRLMEKTEGWPAAVELLSLALQDASDPALLLDDFWGSERAVVDYLGEVVFGRLSQAQRELLYQFAQFDLFCTALLCEASGNPQAGELLVELNQRKLFLLAMDRSGTWFRFHHLVQDYLRSNPPPGQAGHEARTLKVGALWLYAQGMIDEAIDCSIRARDWEQACNWLAASAEDSAQRQGTSTALLRWAKVIPRQWIDRYPLIRISVAFSLVFSERRDETEAELYEIEQCLDAWTLQHPEQPATARQFHCALELQRLFLLAANDAGSSLLQPVKHWLERWPDARLRYLGDACNLAAFASKANGNIAEGLAYTERAHAIQRRDRGYYGLSWNSLLTALLQLKAGNLQAARSTSQAGMQLIQEHLNGNPEHAAYQHVIQAAIAYEFDQFDTAEQQLEIGTEAIDSLGIADIMILTYLTRARLQCSRGNLDAGLQALRLGRQTARKRRLERVIVTLAAEECIWLLRSSEQGAALSLAHQFGFDLAIFPQHNLAADKASRVGPRLLLNESPEMAVAQLGSPLIRSTEKGFQLRRTELLVLQAAALLRCGRETEALAAWQQAIAACTEFGYRRVLLNDLPLIESIRRLARAKGEVAEPEWLTAADSQPSHGQGVAETLTKKELRILALLESGLSNREIAESIFISEGTLKWHLHNVYRKLDCKSRTGALSAARKNGLLQAAV